MTTPASAKQSGTTASERLIAAFCERSFLQLWSYPNVYRDQSKRPGGHGKELCDLLAVFGDDVVIFSDKACAFPTGAPDLSWRRWYRRAVYDSTKQLAGAERWIRRYPTRVYLDRACLQRFPIDLPPPERMRVHRVVVASGAGAACRQYYDGGSGSLMLCPLAHSPLDECLAGDMPAKPFMIGRLSTDFAHVFDEVSLPIVMRELDTAADFIEYLRDKEALIRRDELVVATGEEQLLATYLQSMLGGGRGAFPTPPAGLKLFFEESLWPGLASSKEFDDLKKRQRLSYAWDAIMQQLSEDILESRMVMGNEDGPAGHERRVRALASAPRRVRLDLCRALLPLLRDDSFPTRFRAVRHGQQPDTAYLFVVLTNATLPNDAYRKTRGELLRAYCMCFARHTTDVRHIVGIGTGPSSAGDDRSHEVVYIDRSEWTTEDDSLAKELEDAFQIFNKIKTIALDELT